jgi:hypothetical protein
VKLSGKRWSCGECAAVVDRSLDRRFYHHHLKGHNMVDYMALEPYV